MKLSTVLLLICSLSVHAESPMNPFNEPAPVYMQPNKSGSVSSAPANSASTPPAGYQNIIQGLNQPAVSPNLSSLAVAVVIGNKAILRQMGGKSILIKNNEIFYDQKKGYLVSIKKGRVVLKSVDTEEVVFQGNVGSTTSDFTKP